MNVMKLSALVITAVIATACAKGEEGTDTSAAVAATMDSAATNITREYSDAEFVGLLGAANAAEIEVGNMAAGKATDAEVKAFASKLATEHKALQGEVDALTAKLGLMPTMPRNDEDIVEDHTEAMQDLSTKTGKEFDEAFMEKQISMHKKVLDEINDALSRSQNADLRALLEKAKTGIEAHLRAAEEIEKKFGV